ncbi:MAG: Hsp20/alpha crystallin family protein [Gemmatimonadota bacterium]
MALVRWQPREVFNVANDFDRLFEGMWGSGPAPEQARTTWWPSIDISETDEEIAVVAEVPGMKAEDLKVTVANGVLTIEGEKKEEKQEPQEKQPKVFRIERTYGAFRRAFRLPTAVNADKISASYKDGVLKLSIPKAETAKTRQIEVKAS